MSRVVGYRSGQDRNKERALSHTYAMTAAGGLWPMCGYATPGTEGDCKVCARNVAAERRPVHRGFRHKTKWL